MKKKVKGFFEKYDILGVLFLLFCFLIVLSWIIKPGSFLEGTLMWGEAIVPLGFFDILRAPLASIVNASHFVFFFLLVGGLYGVLNQTGIYDDMVKRMAKRLGDKTVLIVTLFFVLMGTITGNFLLLFVLVPFFMAVVLVNKHDKITALAVTIGAMLIGNMVGIFHSIIVSTFKFYYEIEFSNNLIEKLIVLGLFTGLYLMWINKRKEKKKEMIPLYEEKKGKTKLEQIRILSIISIVFIAFLAVVMYDWFYAFNIEAVQQASESITQNEYASKILGNFNAFGSWSIYDISVILFLYILVIMFIFQMKYVKVSEGFIWGAKQMIKPALFFGLTLIAYYSIMITQGESNIYNSIVGFFFNLFQDIEVIAYAFSSLIGSLFYNNMGEMIFATTNFAAPAVVTANSFIALTITIFYGLGLLFVPTSGFLVVGLSMLDISYCKWLKYIYKLLLVFAGVGLALSVMMHLL